jgi:hypothetical protein
VEACGGKAHYIVDVEELAGDVGYEGKRCDYSVNAEHFTILVEIKCGSISASLLREAEEQLDCGKSFLETYSIAQTIGKIVVGKKIDSIAKQYLLTRQRKGLVALHSGLRSLSIASIQFKLSLS